MAFFRHTHLFVCLFVCLLFFAGQFSRMRRQGFCVTLLHGVTGLSAVCDSGYFLI